MRTGAEIEKIYATALFELAIEEKSLGDIYKELNACAEIFRREPEFAKLLSSPNIPLTDKLKLIGKIFGDGGAIANLVCVMTRNRRIMRIDGVCAELNKLYNEKNNIAEMTVYTAVPLGKAERETLTAKLAEKSGKTVKLTEKTDPELIGGIVVRYNNKVMDGSVKAKLRKIAGEIKLAN